MFFFLKLFFTVTLLIFIFKNIELEKLYNIFVNSEISYLILACIIQFLLSIVQNLRWLRLSYFIGLKLSFFDGWRNVLIGLFFNQTLISSIGGDAVRVILLSNYGYLLVFKTIFIDRLFALYASCFLCFLGYFFTNIENHSSFDLFEFFLLLPIFSLILFLFVFFFDKISIYFKVINKVTNKIKFFELVSDLKRIILNLNLFSKSFSLSIFIQLGTALSGILILKSLNLNINHLEFSFLFIFVLLISTIPVSLGGWGIRENIMVIVMSSVGLKEEFSLSLSIIFGLIMLLVGIPGGLLWLLGKFKVKLRL